jgi:hypothetical protein
VGATLVAFVAPATSTWPTWGARGLGVLALVLATLVVLHGAADVAAHRWAAVASRVVLVAVGVAALGGLLAGPLAGVVAGAPGPEADAGRLAVVRTGVVGLAALALALSFRLWGHEELRWLSYLALVAGGVKLLVEDLRLGNAGTTAVGLALYGVALILAPAVARRRAPGGSTAVAGDTAGVGGASD